MGNQEENGTYKDDMGEITIPQESFRKWAIKSSNLIRQHTFNNINESASIPDKVQYCCCELADIFTSVIKEIPKVLTLGLHLRKMEVGL